MEIIWDRGPLSAKEISLIAADSIGWNKNTTYIVLKKLEAKDFIRRDEPGYWVINMSIIASIMGLISLAILVAAIIYVMLTNTS